MSAVPVPTRQEVVNVLEAVLDGTSSRLAAAEWAAEVQENIESEDSEADEDQSPGDSEEEGETEGAESDYTESDEDQPGEAGEVVIVDLETGRERVVATTRGWETQMGANVQWGATDADLFFNDVDPTTWKKRTVKVVDTTKTSDPGTQMLEVRYTYVDDAVVPVSMATKSSFVPHSAGSVM